MADCAPSPEMLHDDDQGFIPTQLDSARLGSCQPVGGRGMPTVCFALLHLLHSLHSLLHPTPLTSSSGIPGSRHVEVRRAAIKSHPAALHFAAPGHTTISVTKLGSARPALGVDARYNHFPLWLG